MHSDNNKIDAFIKEVTYYDCDEDQTERVKRLEDDLSGVYTAKRTRGASILSRSREPQDGKT